MAIRLFVRHWRRGVQFTRSISMITADQAKNFALGWIAAWNARDLDRVLSHYADDFELSSPLIAAIAGEPSGLLKGKDAIRRYWSAALAKRPDLHFRLVGVYAGVGSIVVHYQRHDGSLSAEHFEFLPNGLVGRSSAHPVTPEI